MSQNLGRLGHLLVSVGGASNSMVEIFDGKSWADQGPFKFQAGRYQSYSTATIADELFLFGRSISRYI